MKDSHPNYFSTFELPITITTVTRAERISLKANTRLMNQVNAILNSTDNLDTAIRVIICLVRISTKMKEFEKMNAEEKRKSLLERALTEEGIVGDATSRILF